MTIYCCSHCGKPMESQTSGSPWVASEVTYGLDGSVAHERRFCSYECHANAYAQGSRNAQWDPSAEGMKISTINDWIDVLHILSKEDQMKALSTIDCTPPKATKIRIEYDDGSTYGADGEDAAKIMDWYNGCEVMASIHGSKYSGPKLKALKAKSPRKPKKKANRNL